MANLTAHTTSQLIVQTMSMSPKNTTTASKNSPQVDSVAGPGNGPKGPRRQPPTVPLIILLGFCLTDLIQFMSLTSPITASKNSTPARMRFYTKLVARPVSVQDYLMDPWGLPATLTAIFLPLNITITASKNSAPSPPAIPRSKIVPHLPCPFYSPMAMWASKQRPSVLPHQIPPLPPLVSVIPVEALGA